MKSRRAPLAWCYSPGRVEAGVDEAGRGCLAGPVFAAAVVWPSAEERPDVAADPRLAIVRDSKTLSPAQRARAREFVESSAVSWAVGSASADEIDRVNILHASHRAMHRALDLLHRPAPAPAPAPAQPPAPAPALSACGGRAAVAVDFVIADGDRFDAYISPTSDCFVPHACFPSGDDRFLAIAAASVLAKTYRDAYVCGALHPRFPMYRWDESKGYGTAAHMRALDEHGPCAEHRRSFAPVARAVANQLPSAS